MNQILSTSMPMDNNKKRNKNRNNKPVAIGSVLKFFGIVILFFGVFIVGAGVYSVYRNQSDQLEQDLNPMIAIENKDDNTVLLKVTHKKNISKVLYSWNDEEHSIINGNGGKYVEQEIDIPSGTNTLHVVVQDENGNEIPYEKDFEGESNINIEVSGNKIKISYNGDKTISYMTYKWDEEQEEKVEINDTSIEKEIEALKGLHELTVTVVDEDNNIDKKVQKINGVSKPKLVIDIDDERKHFVINASDDEMLARIEFRLNQDDEKKYMLNLEEMNLKELEYVLPMELQTGENLLEVIVYNSNGVTEEAGVRYMKQ